MRHAVWQVFGFNSLPFDLYQECSDKHFKPGSSSSSSSFSSSSSSIVTEPLWVMACSTIVEYSQQEGFYRVPSNVTSNPQLGGPVIRTFQLPPPGVPHVWKDASEPQQRKVKLWARNCREFCRKWRILRHVWLLLLAVNLRYGTEGFTFPPKEGVLRIFARKILRFRPGLNPRTWVPKASTLTSRPPKPPSQGLMGWK